MVFVAVHVIYVPEGSVMFLSSFLSQISPVLVDQWNLFVILRSKLTNDDFRKLLMTPRATPSSAPPSKTRHHEYFDFDIYLWSYAAYLHDNSLIKSVDIFCCNDFPRMPREYNEDEDPAARRRKKKR